MRHEVHAEEIRRYRPVCVSGQPDGMHEVKHALMKYISGYDRLFFDFRKVTAVDRSFIDIFYAAYNISKKLGKRPVLLGLERMSSLEEHSFLHQLQCYADAA